MLIDFENRKKLVEKYKLPISKEHIISKEEDLVPFFNKKVVIKLYGEDVLHRLERNLIFICNNEKEMKGAFSSLKKGKGDIILQEKEEGFELFCGMKIDKVFGRIFAIGWGGVYVEIIKDITYGIGEIDKKKAKDMIGRLKCNKILKGFRGRKYSVRELENFLVKFSLMCIKEEIKEVDINPLFISDKGIKIVDLKIII